MCSTSWFLQTSMWTSAWCRPLRSGTIAPWSPSVSYTHLDVYKRQGFNGEKYELILTPEGDKVKLFELVYFQKHAPKRCV